MWKTIVLLLCAIIAVAAGCTLMYLHNGEKDEAAALGVAMAFAFLFLYINNGRRR